MDFRKTFFLLPNIVTLASVFCGFYAVTLCAKIGESGSDESELMYKAAIAIMFGVFFDTTDGRIARLTKTQSDLGRELDSLADAITFGVAPALLIYRWGLEGLERIGLYVAFFFVACGILRLARFNVLEGRAALAKTKKGPGKYMLGLPIPVAACALVALVLANRAIGIEGTTAHILVAALVTTLGILMISKVRFRTMKDLQPDRRTLAFAGILVTGAILVGARFNKPAVLIFLIICYITLGIAEEMRFFTQKTIEARAARRLGGLATADDVTEAEVLEELGANDLDLLADGELAAAGADLTRPETAAGMT